MLSKGIKLKMIISARLLFSINFWKFQVTNFFKKEPEASILLQWIFSHFFIEILLLLPGI